MLGRIEQAGAGAVVLPSLFEEQITHDQLELDRLLATGAESSPEAFELLPRAGRTTSAAPTTTSI